MKRLLIVTAFSALTSVAHAESDDDKLEREWNRIVNYPTALQDFLVAHPDSKYMDEGRAILDAKRVRPPGKLVEGGKRCAALVEERARGLVERYAKIDKFADYDFTIPNGYFEQHPTIEFAPRSVPADQVNLEHLVALDLVAKQNGKCTMMNRWRMGTGLPDECQCAPVDPDFVFQSKLAKQVLTRYSQLLGANAACAQVDVSYESDIEGYLDDWIAGNGKWLQAVRDKQARGEVVYPSERGEAEQVEFAIPQVEQKTLDKLQFNDARRNIGAKDETQLSAYCREQLPEFVKRARMGVLFSTTRLQ